MREIKIEDLLEPARDPRSRWTKSSPTSGGKTVLVTGAAGSIEGAELCRQLANFGVERLILFDNAETPMRNDPSGLEERYPALRFVPVIGDVRIPARLDFVFGEVPPPDRVPRRRLRHVP